MRHVVMFSCLEISATCGSTAAMKLLARLAEMNAKLDRIEQKLTSREQDRE
jgi:hypothetical protein